MLGCSGQVSADINASKSHDYPDVSDSALKGRQVSRHINKKKTLRIFNAILSN